MRLRLIKALANRVDSLGQIIFMVGLALVVSMLLIFAADREPPFKLISYTASTTYPGGKLIVDAVVERDLAKQCTVTFTRRMVSSNGLTFWTSPPAYYNSASLEQLEHKTPHELKLALDIPTWAPIGEFEVVTALDYVCNPLHYIWPVEVLMTIKSEVKDK